MTPVALPAGVGQAAGKKVVTALKQGPSLLNDESPGPLLHRSDDDHFWLKMLVM
jgi:hypothetical protein